MFAVGIYLQAYWMFGNIKSNYQSLQDEKTELDVLLGEEDRFMSKFENTNPAREDEEPVLLKDQYILPDEKMEMVRPPVPEGYSSGEIAPDFLFVDASCPFDGLFTSFFGCCCCWCHENNLLIVVAMGCWGIVNKNSWI